MVDVCITCSIPEECSKGGVCTIHLHTICISHLGTCLGERLAVIGNFPATTPVFLQEAPAIVDQTKSNAPLPMNCTKSLATICADNSVAGTN